MEELAFTDGDIEVVVLPEAGARMHRILAFGHELLRTPDDLDAHVRDPFFWGSPVMAPWCNRLAADAIEVGGRTVNLRSNFPDGSAIHGQVYDREWEADGAGGLRVRAGGDGWPWEYVVGQRVEVSGNEIRLELTLTNAADEPMPAGLGIHPWFRRPLGLAVRADGVFPDNAAMSARPEPVAGPFNLREIGPMTAGLDATWTHLADPPVLLAWPALGIAATLRVDPPGGCIVAASPPDLDAIAVEPQTHAPQGLRRLIAREPFALALLPAGASLTHSIALVIERVS